MNGNVWVRFVKFFSVIILTAVFTFSTLYFIFGLFDSDYYLQSRLSQSELITGMVPHDTEEITPTYSEEDFNLEELNQYDNLIMESCEAAHYKTGDCYYLMKSILSVTSRGNPNYEDEGRFGLVPMKPSEPDITSSDLQVPEKNLRYAARQIMRLYDVYSGNLAFTSLAYFSTRPLANEVMYYFQRNIADLGDSITLAMVFEVLDNVHPDLYVNQPGIPELENVKQFYINVLFAYNVWAGAPIPDANPQNLLYDYGTYSVRPSFTAETKYNITEINIIKEIIDEFIEYSEDVVDGRYEFPSLYRFIEENYEHTASEPHYHWVDPDTYIAVRNLKWKRGTCNPLLTGYEDFVKRFTECLDVDERGCYCDFFDVVIPDGYYIMVRFQSEEEDGSLNRRMMYIELYDDDDNLFSQYSRMVTLRGSLDRLLRVGFVDGDVDSYDGLSGTSALDTETSFKFERTDQEAWRINNNAVDYRFLKNSFLGSSSGTVISSFDRDIIGFVRNNDDFEFGDACEILPSFEKVCVESAGTQVYDSKFSRYTPVTYNFAFAVNPRDLMEENFPTTHLFDNEDFNASVAGNSLTVQPLTLCEESTSCNENILMGKPAHYHNKRDNIVIHSLPHVSNSAARRYFAELLDSEIEFFDWLDEKHKAVHYLLDGEGRSMKLVREDSTVQFTRCFDGSSVHVGLTGDSNKFSDEQMAYLVKLVFEIMARNGIPLNNVMFNNDLETPSSFPSNYDCRAPNEFAIGNEDFRERFFIELRGLISQQEMGVEVDADEIEQEYLSRTVLINSYFGSTFFGYFPEHNDFCLMDGSWNAETFTGAYLGVPKCTKNAYASDSFENLLDGTQEIMETIEGVSGDSYFDVFMQVLLLPDEGDDFFHSGEYLGQGFTLEVY